jgi:hypothetical protein
MSKRKNSVALLSVGTTIFNGEGNRWLCFAIEVRPSGKDLENAPRMLRDMGRAIKTFELIADLEDEHVFVPGSNHCFGPFVYPDGKDFFGFVVFQTQEELGDKVPSKVRAGLNGAIGVLKQSEVRCRQRIKPIEQLMLPGMEMIPTMKPESEESESEE